MMSVSHRQCFPFLFIIVIIVILNVSSFKQINNVFAKEAEQSISLTDMPTTYNPLWISKYDSSTTNEALPSSSIIPTKT